MAPTLSEHLSGAVDKVAKTIGLEDLAGQKDIFGIRKDTVKMVVTVTANTFQIQDRGGLIAQAKWAANGGEQEKESAIYVYERAIPRYREGAIAAGQLGDMVMEGRMNRAADSMEAIVKDLKENNGSNVLSLLDALSAKLAEIISP